MAHPNAPRAPARRVRGSLSSAEILDACSSLIAREGLDGLSMPALGQELDAGVTSIYWYFRNKDELLGALAERVALDLLERLPAAGARPWDELVAGWFRALRAELVARPWEADLLARFPRSLPNRPAVAGSLAEIVDRHLAALVAAGLDVAAAATAWGACWDLTRGWLVLARGQDRTRGGIADLDELAATAARLDPDAYPVLSVPGALVAATAVDDVDFDTGLAAILAGVRAQLPAPGRDRAR